MIEPRGGAGRRRGITLTEILIAIMILGVGLVSLATLFPIGLMRLRDANRYTRSALLLQTAASDAAARGLLNSPSFSFADNLNYQLGLPKWYTTVSGQQYNPLIQDTPSYYGNWINNGVYLGAQATYGPGVPLQASGGPGLPFAYDPLWRYQTLNTANTKTGYYNGTTGYYLGDPGALEARFAAGLGFVRTDPDGGPPSAHGLQRLTNFNRPYVSSGNGAIPVMASALFVPNVFASQEDIVWQDPKATDYTLNGIAGAPPVFGPSPVLPDLNIGGGTPSLDWRYSWMFTGHLASASNLACFDGNIVIFENRPFGIEVPANMPFSPGGNFQAYQVEGETVVEAIFGYSNNVLPASGGYGAAADRTVLLRWSDSVQDPVVRVGDWIADVTYERQQQVIYNQQSHTGRFFNGNPPAGYPNPTNSYEWDNLPAQRCWWYQVQKVVPASPDHVLTGFRSMTVYVSQSLQSRTVLTQGPNGPVPVHVNAALIAPNVVNVIPQTIFSR